MKKIMMIALMMGAVTFTSCDSGRRRMPIPVEYPNPVSHHINVTEAIVLISNDYGLNATSVYTAIYSHLKLNTNEEIAKITMARRPLNYADYYQYVYQGIKHLGDLKIKDLGGDDLTVPFELFESTLMNKLGGVNGWITEEPTEDPAKKLKSL
jgi:hypothetical protein